MRQGFELVAKSDVAADKVRGRGSGNGASAAIQGVTQRMPALISWYAGTFFHIVGLIAELMGPSFENVCLLG